MNDNYGNLGSKLNQDLKVDVTIVVCTLVELRAFV